MEKYNFKFYYGNESEQFNFYRIPKVLFTDERFAKISVEAKVLYGLMLDRMCLSVKNGWIDEENRVYIYFKLEEVTECLNIGKDKCLKLFSELDVKSGIGLIQRKKQGLGKPAMIYVMNFTSNMTEVKTSEIEAEDNSVSAQPKTEEHRNNADCKVLEVRTSEKTKSEIRVGDNQENAKTAEVLTSENPTSRVRHSTEVLTSTKPKSALPENRSQEFGFSDSNDTNINNTDFNDTESILSNPFRVDRNSTEKSIKKNIEYDILINRHKKEDIDGIVNIMVDIVCSTKPYMFIAGEKIHTLYVSNKMLTLNSRHIEYVMDSLKNNTTKVHNIKSYLITMLYNAPSTMGHYYRAEVNHDMNGGRL